MENVKGILNILLNKDNLNDEEKKIADEYYNLEKAKIILDDKNKHKTITDSEKKELVELKKLVKQSEKKISNIRIKVSEKIKNTFNNIGYNVDYKLLNSANYGVPQLRERVIFIATRNDLGLNITFPIPTHSKRCYK